MALPLKQIQPGILKAHGRKHTRFIFIQFLPDFSLPVFQKWLHQSYFTPSANLKMITNAQDQLEEHKAYNNSSSLNEFPSIQSIVATLHVSYSGLQKIGQARLPQNEDQFFQKGMKSDYSIGRLFDPPTEAWQRPYQQEMDLMIGIASDTAVKLDEYEGYLEKTLTELGKVIHIEQGYKMMRGKDAIEPFGFKDNISNPCFIQKQIVAGQKVDYTILQDQFFLALDERGGSFLVFRKLEQDVAAFKERSRRLANELGIAQAYAEAQMVGRFKDGTPLVFGDDPSKVSKTAVAHFDLIDTAGYGGDEAGTKCPFHAHIRRCNPREDRIANWEKSYAKRLKMINDPIKLAELEHTKKLFGRIVRRGVPYLEENGQTGLLFLCYQASISDQFVVIQKNWCNEPNLKYNGQDIGLDPLVGKFSRSFKPEYWNKWHTQWNGLAEDAKTVNISFHDLVELKGGAYFYAPSVRDLRAWVS